ncbi:MAG: ABC transporter substrate-binding protein, partial [Candidatus Saccharicenans sp.]
DSPTSNEVFKAIQETLNEYQKRTGEQIELVVKKGNGQVALLPELARELSEKARILVPISTPALQAAILASDNLPIVFSSVANPYIVRAGRTAVDHDPRVTGVCSTAPVRQVIELIHQLLPEIRKVGTIWTPSEINSEYYLELTKEAASEFGLEVIGQPISGGQDIVQAVQSLVRDGIRALFPVSDNTINANFELVGKLAEENRLPLFAAFSLGAELGACASMGFDFGDIGQKTGELIIRIKRGESPARIPFQYIDRVRFYVNQEAARKQGLKLPEAIVKKADGIVHSSEQEGKRPLSGRYKE